MGASPWQVSGESVDSPAGSDVAQVGGDVLVGGRYRLRERLGVQDGSLTWRAADEALNRPVMVWTFPPGSLRAGAVVALARAACQLADPRLLLIYDADDEGEFPYVVGEWPPGRPLGELLAVGPREPASAAAMVAEAAGALAAAHASGLAHLCLRPSSLWQRATGEVKVCGVGVAAALAGIESAEPVLADTQGLGNLLYAALTGYWPGTEQTSLPAAPRHGDRVYSPRYIRAGIPGKLDTITCRALGQGARDAGPQIVDPAQLAEELARAAGAYSPRRRDAADLLTAQSRRTGPLAAMPMASSAPGRQASATVPSFTLRTAITAAEPPPVVPARWSCPPPRSGEPAGGAAGPQPVGAKPSRIRDHPVTGSSWSPPTAPMRRRRGYTRGTKAVLAATLALAALVLLGAGGWSLAHHGIAREKAGLGTVGIPNPARRSAALARNAGRPLQPVSAQAFDPYGQSDNSQLAPLAIDHDLATAWQTEWYASPMFGNLKPGTGLLLDMGRVVTITGARILLGSSHGAGFQLRAGVSAGSLPDLPVLARETGAGGWVTIQLSRPVHARYVVIWFTRLPPDASGTFQASVFDVSVEGQQ